MEIFFLTAVFALNFLLLSLGLFFPLFFVLGIIVSIGSGTVLFFDFKI